MKKKGKQNSLDELIKGLTKDLKDLISLSIAMDAGNQVKVKELKWKLKL